MTRGDRKRHEDRMKAEIGKRGIVKGWLQITVGLLVFGVLPVKRTVNN